MIGKSVAALKHKRLISLLDKVIHGIGEKLNQIKLRNCEQNNHFDDDSFGGCIDSADVHVLAGLLHDFGLEREAEIIEREFNELIAAELECPLLDWAGADSERQSFILEHYGFPTAPTDSKDLKSLQEIRWTEAVGHAFRVAERLKTLRHDITATPATDARTSVASTPVSVFSENVVAIPETILPPTPQEVADKLGGQSDTPQKNQKRSKRRLLDCHAKACIKEFKEYVRLGERQSMLDIVTEYVAKNVGVSQSGTYRRLTDNSDQWST